MPALGLVPLRLESRGTWKPDEHYWGYIHNRPFLRCLSGLGLCLWRLDRFAEAERLFDRMLWLNPTDNQGVRFLVDDVRARKPWTDD